MPALRVLTLIVPQQLQAAALGRGVGRMDEHIPACGGGQPPAFCSPGTLSEARDLNCSLDPGFYRMCV